MAKLSKYRLRKWSIHVRRRDQQILSPRARSVGRFPCWICGGWFASNMVNAHHIKPKSLFPEIAFDLNNGITICLGCHMLVCHGTKHRWKRSTFSMCNYTKKGVAKRYNEEYQWRID